MNVFMKNAVVHELGHQIIAWTERFMNAFTVSAH